jgi:hypothetical protein
MSDIHKKSYPHTSKNSKITLDCFKLDDFVKKEAISINGNVLIKIDVQGAEKLVLEGASELLQKTNIIFSEINFNSVYNGNVLFNDLSSFLFDKGFRIEGIENISQSLVDGTYLQGDAYFTKIN